MKIVLAGFAMLGAAVASGSPSMGNRFGSRLRGRGQRRPRGMTDLGAIPSSFPRIKDSDSDEVRSRKHQRQSKLIAAVSRSAQANMEESDYFKDEIDRLNTDGGEDRLVRRATRKFHAAEKRLDKALKTMDEMYAEQGKRMIS